MIPALATLLIPAAALLGASPSRADAPSVSILPARLQEGFSGSLGACPCLRWKILAKVGGGRWETREFLVTTDALAALEESRNPFFANVTSRLLSAGAVEALWKRGHVGLGFDGVTWGDSVDRGYSDILRTGLHVLASLVRGASVRADARAGYQYYRLKTYLGGPGIELHRVPVSLSLAWRAGAWSGFINTGATLPAAGPLRAGDAASLGAAVDTRLEVLDIGGLRAALGLNVSAERDPLRELQGLEIDSTMATLYLDLSLLPFGDDGAWERERGRPWGASP